MAKRSLITLTLVGLAALFIFPVCVNAQVADGCGDNWKAEDDPLQLLPVEDEYTLTPTFRWIAASGGTNYTITLDNENTFADPTLQTGTATDEDCEKTDHDDNPDTDDVSVCSWTPATPLPSTGDVFWKVGGTGACAEGDTFNLTEVTADSEKIVTPKVATFSVTTDTTGYIRPGTAVPVTVSMANPGFDATTVSFEILYDSGKFDPPTGTLDDDLTLDPDLATAGFTAADITFDATTAGTVVSVTLTGSDTKLIPADLGQLMDLVFTVKDDATLGAASPAFTVQNMTVTAPGDEPIDVPIASSTAEKLEVTVSPEAGDADGMNGITLKDAVIFLQVAAAQSPTVVYAGADVDGDGVVGVPEAISVMAELAQP